MPRLARLAAACLVVLAATVAGGCGRHEEVRTLGETEGLYIEVDELTYQIQMSRILNPSDREDQGYLRGLAEGVQPTNDETWFAIFLRVQNLTDRTLRPADRFEIVDTTEKTYRPVVLDPRTNVFIYRPDPIRPGEVVPRPDSPSFNGPIQGDLILFKVDIESLYNRPLEFRISSSRGSGTTGIIDIDV
ncbi:MAG TPA: hypothetical protein VN213_12515 [Solirubrobacteraceae bacterium]|nr:hypothetical protein [Solirubrobacteraceae bacterium]